VPRAKGGSKSRQRRKKIMKMAKGYVGGRGRLYKTARETVERGLTYAYRDRKQRKRDFRGLWIVRINAAVRKEGTTSVVYLVNQKKLERHAVTLGATRGRSGCAIAWYRTCTRRRKWRMRSQKSAASWTQ